MSQKVKQPFGQSKDPTVISEPLIRKELALIGEANLPFNEVKTLSLSYKSKYSSISPWQ